MTTPDDDQVDLLVAQWGAERPDLDVEPLRVMSRIDRLARHLDRARRTAFAASGLLPWEFDVLAALYRSGPPYALSPGTLLRATLVTSGTMTNRVDRLAARGLVERHADRTDGRKVSVVLTAEGRAAAGSALGALLTAERAVLAALSPREAADLAALLRRLLSPFDAGHPTVTRRSHDLVPSDHLWPGVHPSPP